MSIINNLKDWVEKLDPKNKVYVCLKSLQNGDLIRCGILKISHTPIGLQLKIDRRIVETITIKKLKIMLEECQYNDKISYMLIEEGYDILRVGGIEGFQIIEGDIYLTSILFPRIV